MLPQRLLSQLRAASRARRGWLHIRLAEVETLDVPVLIIQHFLLIEKNARQICLGKKYEAVAKQTSAYLSDGLVRVLSSPQQ
jgi:hypothetical protein